MSTKHVTKIHCQFEAMLALTFCQGTVESVAFRNASIASIPFQNSSFFNPHFLRSFFTFIKVALASLFDGAWVDNRVC